MKSLLAIIASTTLIGSIAFVSLNVLPFRTHAAVMVFCATVAVIEFSRQAVRWFDRRNDPRRTKRGIGYWILLSVVAVYAVVGMYWLTLGANIWLGSRGILPIRYARAYGDAQVPLEFWFESRGTWFRRASQAYREIWRPAPSPVTPFVNPPAETPDAPP